MPKIFTPEHDLVEEFEPVIIFGVGMYGSCELTFMPAIARNLAANYVSGDRVKQQLSEEGWTVRDARHQAKRLQLRQMMSSILLDRDVVVDAHYNTESTRSNGPALLGKTFDATVVAFQFDLDDPEFAKRRVRRWIDCGEMVAPLSSWKGGPLAAIDNSIDNIQPVGHQEYGVDHVVRVDARLPLDMMIEQTMAELATAGVVPG